MTGWWDPWPSMIVLCRWAKGEAQFFPPVRRPHRALRFFFCDMVQLRKHLFISSPNCKISKWMFITNAYSSVAVETLPGHKAAKQLLVCQLLDWSLAWPMVNMCGSICTTHIIFIYVYIYRIVYVYTYSAHINILLFIESKVEESHLRLRKVFCCWRNWKMEVAMSSAQLHKVCGCNKCLRSQSVKIHSWRKRVLAGLLLRILVWMPLTQKISKLLAASRTFGRWNVHQKIGARTPNALSDQYHEWAPYKIIHVEI